MRAFRIQESGESDDRDHTREHTVPNQEALVVGQIGHFLGHRYISQHVKNPRRQDRGPPPNQAPALPS